MNELPPVVIPAPRRTGWIAYAVLVSVLLFISLLANLVLFAASFGRGGRQAGLGLHRPQYEEQMIAGDTDTRNKIVVIYLVGLISSAEDGYATEEGMVGEIRDQFRQALDDRHVKAIILRINSPGGEVVASDAIYQVVAEAREQKPVVASIDTLGASGAFYAAMGASHIIANELSLTGSIGVILQSFTFTGLMDKVGVKSYTFKSGKFKDILNPAREPTAAETNLVQNLIMEVYDKFVGIVAKERTDAGVKGMTVEKLRDGLADGRILSGKQAKEAGFVDETGYFDDAVDAAKELGKAQKARVVRYLRPFSLRDVLRIFGKNDQTKVRIEVSPQSLKLEAGKLYFLPPSLCQ